MTNLVGHPRLCLFEQCRECRALRFCRCLLHRLIELDLGQISSMITAKRNKAGEIIRDEKGKVSLPRLP